MRDVSTSKRRIPKLKTPLKTKLASLQPNTWEGLDMTNQGLKHLSPNVFQYTFLKELHLENNCFYEIPKEIGTLKELEILNLSGNKLTRVPVQLCKCYKLRELDLSDNLLNFIPLELGNLINLEIVNLDKNPLLEPFASIYKNRGGIGLIAFCRENNTVYPMPIERLWLLQAHNLGYTETVKVGTYNILSPRCGTSKNFPFLPSCILQPDFRNDSILQEIVSYNVDILCVQEMELHQYKNFFSGQLETRCCYDSVFFPKSRIKHVQTSERGAVDGCAIFWKKNTFQLVEQKNIEFQKIISEDPRTAKVEEIVLRNMRKDNVATIVLLENMACDQLIIVNTHLHWNPEFPEIKFLQIVVLMGEIEKFKAKYPTAGLLLCGDLNSLKDSEVVRFILDGEIDADNAFKFLVEKPKFDRFKHGIKFRDAYEDVELNFTHLVYNFQGVIDFVFLDNNLDLRRILLPPNLDYFDSILTLPSLHLPSDHIFLGAEVFLKNKKN